MERQLSVANQGVKGIGEEEGFRERKRMGILLKNSRPFTAAAPFFTAINLCVSRPAE